MPFPFLNTKNEKENIFPLHIHLAQRFETGISLKKKKKKREDFNILHKGWKFHTVLNTDNLCDW